MSGDDRHSDALLGLTTAGYLDGVSGDEIRTAWKGNPDENLED
jgi:hypothetical protein